MNDSDAKIFRGSVNGKPKYCRVLIRRKRATVEDAIRFFADSVPDIDELCKECTPEEVAELRHAQQCMVTAIDALNLIINCRVPLSTEVPHEDP